jgi:hypothetical protein
LKSFPGAGLALVVGASGAVGNALFDLIGETAAFEKVIGLSRSVSGVSNRETD